MNYFEIITLAKKHVEKHQTRIVNTEDGADILRPLLHKQDVETCAALYLNPNNIIIDVEVISIGVLEGCSVGPREVFRKGIELNAASIIVAHNHPSGKIEPSEEDFDETKRLVEVGEIIGIPVLDAIVFGARYKERGKDYYSFAEHGIIVKGAIAKNISKN